MSDKVCPFEVGETLAKHRYARFGGEMTHLEEVKVTRVLKRYFETSDGLKWDFGWKFNHDAPTVCSEYGAHNLGGGWQVSRITTTLVQEWERSELGRKFDKLCDRLGRGGNERRMLTDEQVRAVVAVLGPILDSE